MRWPFMSRLAHDEAVALLKMEHCADRLRDRNEHDYRVERIRSQHHEILMQYARMVDDANERTAKAMEMWTLTEKSRE